MSKLGKALPPALMAVLVAFCVMMFLTVWYGQNCRSPQRSILIGGAVVVAGCGGAP